VRSAKRTAFVAKQQALRVAVAAGDRLLAARQRHLLGTALTAWKVQVGAAARGGACLPCQGLRERVPSAGLLAQPGAR
jgi:hypothetical protein